MLDLESMIAEWRQAMKRGGIRSREELDELESHLRDAIDEGLHSGVEPGPAFAMAVDRMGAPRLLRAEFQKIQLNRIMKPKTKARLIEGLVVVALIAVQAALLLPIVSKWKSHEALAAWDFAVLAGWTLFVLAGAIVFAKARRLKA